MKEALLIFAKNAEYGKVKTRLAATIGNEHTLLIYRQLLAHTHSITKELEMDKILFYSGWINEKDEWENQVYHKKLQQGYDLGDKMKNAFKDSFTGEYKKIVIIGTDCYELDAPIISEAFIQLNNADVAIGPAADGGYYLLGMKKFHPEIFDTIEWSTSKVLEQTNSVCERLGLSFFLLPKLSDIDYETDLKKYPDLFLMKNKEA
ncbi:MAG: TIGR04282 family arsenosugar biosynthesis glycosyltransferase [Ginsengibacter sp.]